jgi:membrane associated rhomboid family serine protease
MTDDPTIPRAREPIFNDVPAVVLALAAVIVLASGIGLAGPEPLRAFVWNAGAVVVGERPPRPLGTAAPLALHALLHGGWTHLTMNLAGLAAFGVAAARRLGRGPRGAGLFLVLFFGSAVAGAAAQLALPADGPTVMVGASGGVSGLIGAAAYLLGARSSRLPSPVSRRVLGMLAPWVVVNLVIAGAGGSFMGMNVAWVAHIGGLAAGWLAFPALAALADQNSRST